jgi:hypothetical protein
MSCDYTAWALIEEKNRMHDILLGFKEENAALHERVAGKHSENCPFCLKLRGTGHSQDVPMCGLCQLESERDSLLAENQRLRDENGDNWMAQPVCQEPT